jgi:dipeptidyl aminopeptidase/acylaminoacyl peptidase
MPTPAFPAAAAILSLVVIPCLGAAQPAARRPIVSGDLYRLKDLGPPEVSPDGKWVAYTVSSADSALDRTGQDIWMAAWDGSSVVRLTTSAEADRAPRWSPDGRFLSFLSSRAGDQGDQLWLLPRGGGEAAKVTDGKTGISEYAWAPDGKRLVLVATDPDSQQALPPQPIVIDRLLFKEDGAGYLRHRWAHLYLFDLETRKAAQLTSGDFDDASPAWSPDGAWIAFASKRGSDPDRSLNWDLYRIAPRAGAEIERLTSFPAEDAPPGRGANPVWSGDSRSIAYGRGGDPKYWQYNNVRLAVSPSAGGEPTILGEKLDRQVLGPRWAPDGKSLYALLEDDRTIQLARFGLDGSVERLTSGPLTLSGFSLGGEGRIAVTVSTDAQPSEIAAFESGRLRQITHHNDSLASVLELGVVEDFSSTSKDGAIINSLLYRPPRSPNGQRLPLVLMIHGGPFGQNQHEFDYRRQLFAASGYAVLAINYRGSSGRGEAFSHAIFADWGNKEVADILGAVDAAVARGIADPDRLGIGGWSYGGILTDYTIASDTRFKAAVAGAGVANWLTVFGTDEFIYLYQNELGTPWTNLDGWLKVSYPFFHADRIKTPTLFLGGEKDFNVPVAGGEQMYQALKILGVESQLVIYPGMFHGPTRPSYRRDILERFLGWWGKFLKPIAP